MSLFLMRGDSSVYLNKKKKRNLNAYFISKFIALSRFCIVTTPLSIAKYPPNIS